MQSVVNESLESVAEKESVGRWGGTRHGCCWSSWVWLIVSLSRLHTDFKVRCVKLPGKWMNGFIRGRMRIRGQLIPESVLNRSEFPRGTKGSFSATRMCVLLVTFSKRSLPCLLNTPTLYEALPVQQRLSMVFATRAVWCPSRCNTCLLCIQTALCLGQQLAFPTLLLSFGPSSF